MLLKIRLGLVVFTLITSLGCSAQSIENKHREKYQLATNPQLRYDITVTITDSPGLFEIAEGSAYYEAKNCTFKVVQGVYFHPDYKVPIKLHKQNDTTYVGSVYLDAMLDEDYFGQDKCQWQMTSMSVTLKATGANEETRFSPSLMQSQIIQLAPVKYYFWKGRYPKSKTPDFPSFGETNIEKYKPEIRNDLFTITLSPTKI